MNRIQHWRDIRGWSQADLARAVEPTTSQSQINRLENEERKLTVQWAKRLALALGCSWHQLFAEGAEPDDKMTEITKLFADLSLHQQEVLLEVARSMASVTAAETPGLSAPTSTLHEEPRAYTQQRRRA